MHLKTENQAQRGARTSIGTQASDDVFYVLDAYI